MKQDTMNTDTGPWAGNRNDPGLISAKHDLNIAEERDQNAAVVQHVGHARISAESETDRFTSEPTPQCVMDNPVSVRTPLEEAVEHHAQSRRLPRYATAEIVCREDPW